MRQLLFPIAFMARILNCDPHSWLLPSSYVGSVNNENCPNFPGKPQRHEHNHMRYAHIGSIFGIKIKSMNCLAPCHLRRCRHSQCDSPLHKIRPLSPSQHRTVWKAHHTSTSISNSTRKFYSTLQWEERARDKPVGPNSPCWMSSVYLLDATLSLQWANCISKNIPSLTMHQI